MFMDEEVVNGGVLWVDESIVRTLLLFERLFSPSGGPLASSAISPVCWRQWTSYRSPLIWSGCEVGGGGGAKLVGGLGK